MVPSGYGVQTRYLMSQLKSLGHEVAVSAFHGLTGSPITWEGNTIYPAGQHGFGLDTILAHARQFEADLIITLMDFWQMIPVARDLADSGIRLAAWLPVDCTPLSRRDEMALRLSRARPIAMSAYGKVQLQAAGYADTLYVPHATDVAVFSPRRTGPRYAPSWA